MFGAIVSLLLVVAAAFAVTQIGGVITLLFIAAVLFLAYRRLSLIDLHGAPSRCCSWPTAGSAPSGGHLEGPPRGAARGALAAQRAPAAQGADHAPVHEGLPEAAAPRCRRPRRRRWRRAPCGGTGSCSPARRAGRSCSPPSRRSSAPKSRRSSTDRAKSCAACSMTGTSPTSAAICRRRCGSSSRPAASSR